MTEEEARKKWCPFARYTTDPDTDGVCFNRWGETESPVRCACIASDCMAWRNEIEFIEDDEGVSLKEPAEGYCGLAGKP